MAASASAQNTMTSSPYSMFGLGEMASGLYGQNTSMAGVTVGMREGDADEYRESCRIDSVG